MGYRRRHCECPIPRSGMRMTEKLFRGHAERLFGSTCDAANDQRSISYWGFPGSTLVRRKGILSAIGNPQSAIHWVMQ
jgi:hypothetical protein